LLRVWLACTCSCSGCDACATRLPPLQEVAALKRLLPLLWPLADSATPASRAAAAYPAALRQQLLAALAAYPLPTVPAEGQALGEALGESGGAGNDGASPAADPLAEKRELLLSALRAVWDQP